MNAIELENVQKSYAKFQLKNISLSVPQGTVMGLVGQNGAGKSTLIRIMLGAVRADSGRIAVLGQPPQAQTAEAKNDIGIVLDEPFLPDNFTIAEMERVLRAMYTRWDGAAFAHYVQSFHLPAHKKYGAFSRGMKMKLSIATALSHHARLLVLDEATGGLDPIVRDEVLEVFRDFALDADHTVLLSSHIVSDLEKICDYIAFLHAGELLFCEEKDALEDACGLVQLPLEQLEALPEDAVLGVRKNAFGATALVRRDRINAGFDIRKAALEDIILYTVKGKQ